MKYLIGRPNVLQAFCLLAVRCQTNNLCKYFLRPTLTIVFCVFGVNFLLSNNPESFRQLYGYLPSSWLTFIQEKSVDMVLLILSVLCGLHLLNTLIHYGAKSVPSLKMEKILKLLDDINLVVDNKSSRFRAFSKDFDLDPKSNSMNTFEGITKPGQQILLLTSAMKSTFESLSDEKISYKVGLMRIINEKVEGWKAYWPEDYSPRTTLKELSHPSSAIMKAVKERNMIIIEDIVKELSKKSKDQRRLIKGRRSTDEDGSLIVDPIISPVTNEVEYVITITGDSKKCLTNSQRGLYIWVLSNYKKRLILEHTLHEIKIMRVSQ